MILNSGTRSTTFATYPKQAQTETVPYRLRCALCVIAFVTQVRDQVYDSVFARDLHTNYAMSMQVYRQHRLGVRKLPDRTKKNKRSRLLLGTNGTIVATAFPVKILGTMCIASPKALRRSSSDELINRYELAMGGCDQIAIQLYQTCTNFDTCIILSIGSSLLERRSTNSPRK